MKGFSWIAALTLVVSGHAQQVITVRNQHSKKLINTLQQNEQIVRGETRILVKTDGENYEYLTRLDVSFRHYLNGQVLAILPYAMFNRPAFYAYSERVNGNYVEFAKIGTKRIGPYNELRLYYDDNNALSSLHGYTYRSEEGNFLVDCVASKTYGPYKNIAWSRLSHKEMVFAIQEDNKWQVIDRQKTYGPYDSVAPLYTETEKERAVFLYKKNGSWHIHSKTPVNLEFSVKPDVRFLTDGDWAIAGIAANSDGKQRLYLKNGDSYPHTAQLQTIYVPGLPILTAERPDATARPGASPRFEYNQLYTIKRGDEILGEFYIEYLPGRLLGQPKAIYPYAFYRKLPAGTAASKKTFCLLHTTSGFTDTIPAAAHYNLSVGGDSWAYITGKERALIFNGKPQGKTNVEMVDLTNYPTAWYMAVKEGYYTSFYKNNAPDPTAYLEQKFSGGYFQTRKLPYIVVNQNDKSYVKTPQSTKLYGPVNPRSIFAFSAKNAHYAEGDERNAQILIDGKVMGSGYGLVYNEHKNAFHWVEQVGQKLYLHTYELD